MEAHWLSSKEKVPGTVVSKKGHADSLLTVLFLFPTSWTKFTLFIEWPSYIQKSQCYSWKWMYIYYKLIFLIIVNVSLIDKISLLNFFSD